MPDLKTSIANIDAQCQNLMEQLERETALMRLVDVGIKLGFHLASRFIVQRLDKIGTEEKPSGVCPECGGRLESKGLFPRQIQTLVGELSWKRRVYRCAKGCKIPQVVPSDGKLGIEANQKTSWEIVRLACQIAVLLPYSTSSQLLFACTGTLLSPMAIWNWVQVMGKRAQQIWQEKLGSMTPDDCCEASQHKGELLLMGSDGVMVPFRPNGGSPWGQIKWQEVKIGVIAWMKEKLSTTGKTVWRVVKRRVVGVLGGPEDIESRLWSAAKKEGILHAPKVVWVCDGAKWLWGIFQRRFAPYARPVLDFYHVVQYIWKAASIWLDGRTRRCRDWFVQAREKLWLGKGKDIVDELQTQLSQEQQSLKALHAITALHGYLHEHLEHIDYQQFRNDGLPMGSGLIESACKWLIQQRFKCVGMRWSEPGFNHLFHLRMSWFNGEFDELFRMK